MQVEGQAGLSHADADAVTQAEVSPRWSQVTEGVIKEGNDLRSVQITASKRFRRLVSIDHLGCNLSSTTSDCKTARCSHPNYIKQHLKPLLT